MPAATGDDKQQVRRQILIGIGALSAIVTGLLAVPIALWVEIGWPLPSRISGAGHLSSVIQSPIPDSFWPDLFATLSWIAWAYFAYAVAVETVLAVRGKVSRSRSRLGVQAAIAAVITAVTVMSQLRCLPTTLTVGSSPTVQLVADAVAPASADTVTELVHTVVGGDTLWGIAAQYLGDGGKWREIYQINAGVPQPDGRRLTDSHWIWPGWQLVIPDSSTLAAPLVGPVPKASPVPGHEVDPTQSATKAERFGLHPAQFQRGTTRSSARSDHGEPLPNNDAGLNVHESEVQPRPRTGATPPMTSAPRIATAKFSELRAKSGDQPRSTAIEVGMFGLGAIALVASLDRRRRRQAIHRGPGKRIALPSPRGLMADLELQLRHFARSDCLYALSRLGETLACACDTVGIAHPAVAGVKATSDEIKVVLAAGDDEAPPPFNNESGEPLTWKLSVADPEPLGGFAPRKSLPLALFTAGWSHEGSILVNLEHYRSVHLTVGQHQVEGTLEAAGIELASARGEGEMGVIAVGFGQRVLKRLDRCSLAADVDEVIELVGHSPECVILAESSSLAGRMQDLTSNSPEVLLLTAGPVPPSGIGLVLHPPVTDLEPNFGGCPLDTSPLSSSSDYITAQAEALLDISDGPADWYTDPDTDSPHPDLIADYGPTAAQRAKAFSTNLVSAGRASGASDIVCLGLLGEPTIAVGAESTSLIKAVYPIARGKARRVTELLVYLAAQGGSASRGQWLTDISPDKALADGYVRNIVLLARRSFEALADDPELLTYDRTTQRLCLDSKVVSDWSAFQGYTGGSSRMREPGSGSPAALEAALSLVRGMPFGPEPDPWTTARGIYYTVVDEVTDAAIALGEHALGAGDPQLATWAARRGQLANRYDQALWRILLRAAPDASKCQLIWDELNALLAIDGDPAEDIDPATVALYRSLARRTSMSGSEIGLIETKHHAGDPQVLREQEHPEVDPNPAQVAGRAHPETSGLIFVPVPEAV